MVEFQEKSYSMKMGQVGSERGEYSSPFVLFWEKGPFHEVFRGTVGEVQVDEQYQRLLTICVTCFECEHVFESVEIRVESMT